MSNQRLVTTSFHFHKEGVEKAVACFTGAGRPEESCLAQLDKIPGHQIAIAAMATFGEAAPRVSFREAAAGPDVEDYSLAAFRRNREKVASLVSRVEASVEESHVQEIVSDFFPSDAMPAIGPAVADVYLVAFGHSLGDAYAREVRLDNGRWKLDEKLGKTVIVVNLTVVAATYPGSDAEIARLLSCVLAHELFHFWFRRLHRQRRPSGVVPTAGLDRLIALLLDEGVAHYVDRVTEAAGRRWPFPRERAAQLMDEIELVAARLMEASLSAAESDELLAAASSGPYWKKFGSVGGLLLVAAIDERCGRQPIRDLVGSGDPRQLLASYDRWRPNGFPELGWTLKSLVSRAGVF